MAGKGCLKLPICGIDTRPAIASNHVGGRGSFTAEATTGLKDDTAEEQAAEKHAIAEVTRGGKHVQAKEGENQAEGQKSDSKPRLGIQSFHLHLLREPPRFGGAGRALGVIQFPRTFFVNPGDLAGHAAPLRSPSESCAGV